MNPITMAETQREFDAAMASVRDVFDREITGVWLADIAYSSQDAALRERLEGLGYDEGSPLYAAMLARMRSERGWTPPPHDDLAKRPLDKQWSCCEDPQPRVLERNARLFCYSCRRYLDAQNDQRPKDGRAVDTGEGTAGEEEEGQR